MKKIIIISISVLTFTACKNNSTTDNANTETADSVKVTIIDTTKLAKGIAFYQCPMHPEVVSDKAGVCPKCGMDLEKVEKK